MVMVHLAKFKHVILLGDSITQYGASVKDNGWVAQLHDRHQRGVDFTNRGFSGYNTRQMRAILPTVCDWDRLGSDGNQNYTAVFIFLGGTAFNFDFELSCF